MSTVNPILMDLQALDIIEEIAFRSSRTVHSVRRLLRHYSPSLEGEVLIVARRNKLNTRKVQHWYRKQHKEYLENYKMKSAIEKKIAKRQHRAKIHNLLSA